MKESVKVMISGGGTGGHIFPALSIADEIKKRYPKAQIEFVGAQDRMEMQKVPAAGYPIHGIQISGIQRTDWKKNLSFPVKLWKSLLRCKKLIREFNPDIVIGTGGFASGPLLWAAQLKNIPTVIQEQNSYPGITNKLLSGKAKNICVAYDGLEKWFPKQTIVKTGNPVRSKLLEISADSSAAALKLGLSPEKPIVLILGGSLGARAINRAVANSYSSWLDDGYQVLWQCGKIYVDALQEDIPQREGLIITDFIQDMNTAYEAASITLSRAGAGTLSELAIVGKPAILIPSPNVAEDHQTKNAKAFSDIGAAILLPESEADQVGPTVEKLLKDQKTRDHMSQKISALAKPQATTEIVNCINQWIK